MGMWFGTVEGPSAKLQFIECPQSGAEHSFTNTFSSGQYQQGGYYQSQSADSAQSYGFTWYGDISSEHDIDEILAYRSKIYGTGYIYFVDPMWQDDNIFRSNYSNPELIGRGHFNWGHGKPTFSLTPANTNDCPAFTATWALGDVASGDVTGTPFTMIIPPDMTLWIGWRGSASDGGTLVAEGVGKGLTTVSDLTPLSETGSTYLADSFDGSDYQAVRVYMTVDTADPAATVSVTSLVAQLHPTGVTPPLTGSHRHGKGFSGMMFSDGGSLPITLVQAPRKIRTFATQLTEVEPWRRVK